MPSRAGCDAAETEQRSHQRDHEKHDGVVQHHDLRWIESRSLVSALLPLHSHAPCHSRNRPQWPRIQRVARRVEPCAAPHVGRSSKPSCNFSRTRRRAPTRASDAHGYGRIDPGPTLAFTARRFPASASACPNTQGVDMNTTFALTLALAAALAAAGCGKAEAPSGPIAAVNAPSTDPPDSALTPPASKAPEVPLPPLPADITAPPSHAAGRGGHREGQPGHRSQGHADRSRREQRDAEGGCTGTTIRRHRSKSHLSNDRNLKGDLP